MNYFNLYPTEVRSTELVAWEAQVCQAEPWLRELLEARGIEIFPRFLAIYRSISELPRGTWRQLGRSVLKRNDFGRDSHPCYSRRLDRSLARTLARSVAGLALLLALDQSVAGAATIEVSTTTLNHLTDGHCSLLEAISNANNDGAPFPDCAAGNGPDTIVLPARKAFTFQGPTAINFYGDTALLITSAITIEGNGAKLSRRNSNTLYRLITVTESGDLTLRNTIVTGGQETYGGAIFNAGNLTITGGSISRADAVAGGAVFNARYGTLSISNSVLSKSTAYYYGGAVFNYFGTLLIEGSTISGNQAAWGGGVSTYQGAVQIDDCEISSNRAHEGGGVRGRSASVTISNSTVTKNSADTGGGVLNYSGSFTVQSSVITSNKAVHRGGGTQSWNGDFTIESSLISKNQAGSGAGVGTINFVTLNITNSVIAENRSRYSSGGLEIWAGNTTIENTTFVKNRAGDLGGGIGFFSGNLELVNSTVSGNVSKTIGGGIWHQGTGRVSNTTVTGNQAKEAGGGVYNNSTIGGQLYLSRSLITDNRAATGREIFNRIVAGAGTVRADDFNMVGASGSSGISGFSLGATDIVPSAATRNILAPLSDNGGATPTHALLTGSPAIDAVPGAHPDCTGTDQRGVTRPQGLGCDIGAFEK